jgi:DNA-binding MarR family transcriptional regulator
MSREMEALRYGILALQREGQRQLAHLLQPVGLTPSQAEVVRVVAEFGPVHIRKLGSLLVCEAGSPWRLVDSLVRKGILAKHVDPEDVRRTLVSLSAEGVRAAARIGEIEEAFYRLFAQRLPDVPYSCSAAIERLLANTPAGKALTRRGLMPSIRAEAQGDDGPAAGQNRAAN